MTIVVRKILFVWFMLVTGMVKSGNFYPITLIDLGRDTNYITDKSEVFYFRLFLLNKYNRLELSEIEHDKKLYLYPNDITNIGIGFNYKWIGLSLSVPFVNKDENIYGKTKRFDFQVNTYGRTIGFDAYLQHYQGFYIQNVNRLVAWTSDVYPILPDMQTYSMGMNIYYIANNKRFSYRSVFLHNEIQSKSAGTLIYGGGWSLNFGNSPTHFLSQNVQLVRQYDSIFNLAAYKVFNLAVAVGYAHTFVIGKRFFIHLSVLPKVGPSTITSIVSENNKASTSSIGRLTGGGDLRLAIGGEYPFLYWGITGITTTYNYKIKNWEIEPSVGNIKIFVGKQF